MKSFVCREKDRAHTHPNSNSRLECFRNLNLQLISRASSEHKWGTRTMTVCEINANVLGSRLFIWHFLCYCSAILLLFFSFRIFIFNCFSIHKLHQTTAFRLFAKVFSCLWYIVFIGANIQNDYFKWIFLHLFDGWCCCYVC